ncbi:MAG: cyclodeaminase/cyclohydrolase family protein [Synergistetes bacterium]|nr:cyclodeaminase/cyclohydrolase family protein [Synergistota bacterium]
MLLKDLKVSGFLSELSSSSPAPGGGSAAALMGAIGASLVSMVCNLTLGKRGYEGVQDEVKTILDEANRLREELLKKVDEDTDAFNTFMLALKLPKGSKERKNAMQEALRNATLLPLSVMELSMRVLELACNLIDKGNKNAISDVGVSAISAYGSMESAYLNVLINCASISDSDFVSSTKEKAVTLLKKGKELYHDVREKVERGLN